MRPHPFPRSEDSDHGPHTLRVWRGTVVGTFGDDVFVELGPRMQGVISARRFESRPANGAEFDFTLGGLEEGLWSLALAVQQAKSLVTWENLEVGSLVQARAIRVAPGGLEAKIGPLHAFIPKSQSGLPRDQDLDSLVGRSFTCEVIEVDPERARVTVSRKIVLQRERDNEHQRHIDRLAIGDVVQGRVTRIEPYGVFVTFGHGMEGLVHVSNLAHERVAHPSDVVKIGDSLELKVLHVKRGGKRIGLGLKQLRESPWKKLDHVLYRGLILEGIVTRVLDFGAFVSIRPGVEGLVPVSEVDLRSGMPLRSALEPGQPVSVRVLAFDVAAQRLSLSLRHENGARIAADEAHNALSFEEFVRGTEDRRFAKPLGDVLKRVLEGPEPSAGPLSA